MCLGPRFYTAIKLQKMHSILIITFKSHQNLIFLMSQCFSVQFYRIAIIIPSKLKIQLRTMDYVLIRIYTCNYITSVFHWNVTIWLAKGRFVLRWIFIVLAHWKKNPRKDTSFPLGHNDLIASQPVFVLAPECCVFCRETVNTSFIIISLTINLFSPWYSCKNAE
jgi:hypothetical protein